MAGITLKETDDTLVPTPASGKATIFVDDADGLPKYKDDTGTVSTLGGGGGGVVITHISTYTVSGSAVTSFSISGLDLAADECYELHCKFDNATGSSAGISMTYNADTTATNYYRQGVTNNSTTVTSSRGNDALIATMDASEPANAVIRIKLDADGRPRATSHTNYGAAASIKSQRFDHVWTSATNPTGIDFSSSVASSLAIGSEVKVYRIKEP